MFPKYLDNAEVLEYTTKGNYGTVDTVDNGEVVDSETITYYAIAKYPADQSYYLFGCNERFEVISDFPERDIADLKEVLKITLGQEIRWIKKL